MMVVPLFIVHVDSKMNLVYLAALNETEANDINGQ